MLSKQRCPHTGIVNYFTTADPLLSIGSIMKQGADNGPYCWRWYGATETIQGIAKDMRSAEDRLRQLRRKDKASSERGGVI